MILIVSDTGPINYLIQIECVEALSRLADRVVLPSAVRAELLHAGAPEAVRAWASAPPAWIEIRAATQLIEAQDLSLADREAITLATELQASVRLMDDRQARWEAARLGVATMGKVGLLEAAAERELITLSDALEKLRRTSCFVTESIIENALQRDEARRRASASRKPER